MAASLDNITLPANTWVDLYAAASITVGNPIQVQNVGVDDVFLAVSAAEPSFELTAYTILNRKNGEFLRNSTGDSGAWAFSHNGSKINVSEVP